MNKISLLSLPNEILLTSILSRDNITISDLFHLMLSCRQLYKVIIESNQLWMYKFSMRWPEMTNKLLKEKKKIPWKNWMFSFWIIDEVNKAVTSLSSQCYPLGKYVTPVLAFEKWFENERNPIFLVSEDELHDLVFNEEIIRDLTLIHYASVALKKLRSCLQLKNLKLFMATSESQKTLLEGAKLISNWFHFRGYIPTDKLVDNVEQYLQLMVDRVRGLVEKRNSTTLEDILKCINRVLFGKMRFRVYEEDDFQGWKHMAASIHWVVKISVGYPAIVGVIYLELATRMGIECEPFCVDCAHCSERLVLRCRVEGKSDVFYLSICYHTSCDLSSVNPFLIEQPASSFEVIFWKMLKDVVVRDKRNFSRTDPRALASMELVCSLWPTNANVMNYAKLCLEVDDQVEDAYHLLLAAEIDSNDPVMIDCVQRKRSYQSQINEAKVARHRLPSIIYAVGLVVALNSPAVSFDTTYGVIISWDECFREEVSRQKWRHSFTPLTDGYSLDQPFYHIMCFLPKQVFLNRHFGKHFYVPQELLQLQPLCVIGRDNILGLRRMIDIGIYFEAFDPRRLRFVPNAEHRAHFPEDDAVALSMIQQLLRFH